MSDIKGTNVASPIVPFTTSDQYATHDAKYGKGGYRTVQTMAEMYAIPEARKDEGMLVYVINDPSFVYTYRWLDGSWVEDVAGGGIVQVDNRTDLNNLEFLRTPGTVVYLKSEDKFLYYNSSNEWVPWQELIYVGPEEPDNTKSLWVDTSDQHFDTSSEMVHSIQKAIYELQTKVNILMGLRTNGVISGSVTDSTRVELINSAEPEIPDILNPEDYDYDDDSELEPDYPSGDEPTVNHISIKMGSWAQLSANVRNFINGELIWCTDRTKLYIYNNGTLYAVGGGSGSSDDTMDDTRVIELIEQELGQVESIGFIPVGSDTPKYTARVNSEGNLIVYENTLDNYAEQPGNAYYYQGTVSKEGLIINSFYLGGEDNDEHSYQGCSHNFVEISNVWMDKSANRQDITLNGLYLLYTDGTSGWNVLPLWGKIRGGETFLIRGAQCSVMDANTTKIKVKTYDMEWRDESGELIKFSQDSAVFYLCWGTPEKRFYVIGSDTPVDSGSFPMSANQIVDVENSVCAKGYIDLASFNNSSIKEKKTYSLASGKNAADAIFRRWYLMDPVTQSNPKDGIGSHNNVKYLTVSYMNGSNIGEICNINEFTPKASFEHKTMSATRSLFLESEPNTITCSFGYQATDNTTQSHTPALGYGATRGFCWNSVGYFDECLRFRRKGTTDWYVVESVRDDMMDDRVSEYAALIPEGVYIPNCLRQPDTYKYYARKRWESAYGQSVTTHKVLITGLTAGVYEYQVIRKSQVSYQDGQDVPGGEYKSKVREFTVKSDSEIENNGFKFVQTTDQQGASWEEYEVWNLSARMIKKAEDSGEIPNYDFTINTGDICYNGSRSNEWIDYYRGYEPLDNKEEMLNIGNNDLAPISMLDIGNGSESPWKINVNVIDYFYCIEMPTFNAPIFTGESVNSDRSVVYRIPSLYSFNYGPYHFVCLISEIRTRAGKEGDDGSSVEMPVNTVTAIFGIKDLLREPSNNHASAIYDVVEEWLIKDLIFWKTGSLPSSFNRDAQRYNSNIVGQCNKCFVYIHEMPFNIISGGSYDSYEKGSTTPRESAKAYLNRFHNYEFQRLFKLWGIRFVFGGHKHTAALTGPVYDAPPNYNPITKQIEGATDHYYTVPGDSNSIEDILNDKFDSSHTSGEFDGSSSFRPFLQVTPETIRGEGRWRWNWPNLVEYCNEVYNNTNQPITLVNGVDSIVIPAQDYWKNTSAAANPYPRVRVEIINNINAPSYIMCQATGFKNKSNSELAAPSESPIPWENFYVEADHVTQQCYPFFTVYNITANSMTVDMYKIANMYSAGNDGLGEGSKAGYWDLAAKIYVHGNTLEENRDYFVGEHGICEVILYNNEAGNGETPHGSTINLRQ